jgi:S-methylmethionine-dependent homocysteine/selenocysteine methylase
LIEAPAFITRVHEAYVAAGADVITTNSYAVVPFHIGAGRFAASGARLAARAGRLAREVADGAPRRVAVAGSLPPICGSYRSERFDAGVARPVLATLVEALRRHVDHWQAETLSLIAEAELVREVVGADGKPLWLSFTLADDGGQPRLRSGEPVADAVAAAARLEAAAILFNCSQPEVMGPAISVAAATPVARSGGLRIGAYANAFPPLDASAEANAQLHEIRADLDPAGYRAFVRDWIARGASIVGGCCGIGPEHIALLRGDLTGDAAR